jgi:uncharacterized membrane protein YadS
VIRDLAKSASQNSLTEQRNCRASISFASRQILRIGVALLDARISFEMAANVAHWSLLTGWAAVGVSTSLKDVVNVGRAAIALPVP